MSTQKTPGPLVQIAAGLVVLAGISGIYWFQGGGRKAVTTENPPQAGAAATLAGDALATGAIAAFLVKPDRPPLPDVTFADGAGRPVSLSQWKGRVVLVNLWATWCAPCRKEMPDLAALQKELGSADFEVVAISVDRKGAEASATFLEETGADNLALYVEPSAAIVNQLQALGLPATFLVDRQGREIGRLLGPAAWASPEAKALIRAALAEDT